TATVVQHEQEAAGQSGQRGVGQQSGIQPVGQRTQVRPATGQPRQRRDKDVPDQLVPRGGQQAGRGDRLHHLARQVSVRPGRQCPHLQVRAGGEVHVVVVAISGGNPVQRRQRRR